MLRAVVTWFCAVEIAEQGVPQRQVCHLVFAG
jgi:hypothetical protein